MFRPGFFRAACVPRSASRLYNLTMSVRGRLLNDGVFRHHVYIAVRRAKR
jgi:hypothetical protein